MDVTQLLVALAALATSIAGVVAAITRLVSEARQVAAVAHAVGESKDAAAQAALAGAQQLAIELLGAAAQKDAAHRDQLNEVLAWLQAPQAAAGATLPQPTPAPAGYSEHTELPVGVPSAAALEQIARAEAMLRERGEHDVADHEMVGQVTPEDRATINAARAESGQPPIG
jgi:hypothetical protein